MNSFGLHWIRKRRHTFARSVLVLFCVVWLQAALAPCAMAVVPAQAAVGTEEHCPYCPPAHERRAEHATTAGTSTCSFPDKPQSDNRTSNTSCAALPALPVVLTLAPATSVDTARGSESARPPGDACTPLAVSYCRFLK